MTDEMLLDLLIPGITEQFRRRISQVTAEDRARLVRIARSNRYSAVTNEAIRILHEKLP